MPIRATGTEGICSETGTFHRAIDSQRAETHSQVGPSNIVALKYRTYLDERR
ncbi:hypothetical protein BY996DRAFT_6476754 [Phakopsora pachyrhizi]|nr:hypothetical protein BY996DRAFT_6476754 [Phakopsora pachyrhizi]